MSTESYADYREWKGWSSFRPPTEEQIRYFTKEMTLAEAPPGGSLLEIGFGQGEFLVWAAEQGYKTSGVELIPELVHAAREQGVNAWAANLAENIPDELQESGPFDVILALDVMEHMSPEDSKRLLTHLYTLSVPGCKFILRFPNGESPFSTRIQNGDYTHLQWMTRSKLEQYCVGSGWQVLTYRNAARCLSFRGFKGLLKRCIYPLRSVVEITLGALYWYRRVPLDPVATAVLVREP